jgi:hypothetical protein
MSEVQDYSLELGNIRDENRLRRTCLRLMTELSKFRYDVIEGVSIDINGFVTITGNRYMNESSTLLQSFRDEHVIHLIRREDDCLLYEFRTSENLEDHIESIANLLLSEIVNFLKNPDHSLKKCLRCRSLAISNNYCLECIDYCTTREEVCSICLDEKQSEACWVMIPCRHVFHAHCLSKLENMICPLCRSKFEENDVKCW